jgi:thiamine biosynthesis lipoprotein
LNRIRLSKLIALSIGLLCIFLAYNYNKSATYQTSGPIFGTYWKLVSTEYVPDSLIKSIDNELNRIDLIASNYKTASELSFINQSPINREIKISFDMYSLLSFAENLNQKTNGFYDITLGSLVINEGFGPKKAMIANPILVSNKRFEFISNSSIIKKDNFQFDLSSIAKGYAVDAIAQLLISADRNNFLIDIGGEIIANGSKHGAPWIIGIQDPSTINNKASIEIYSNDFLAVATSGEYRNYKLNDDGVLGSHTFNPKTKQSIKNKSYSVTVVSEHSSMVADAWATALNVLGPEQGIKVANKQDVSVMYIMQENNNLIKSDSWNYSD